MAKFELQHNEAVILRAESVAHGSGMMSNHTDELILTNLHLIWISKGVFGNVKRTEHYPLGLIKVFNDRAQALVSQTGGSYPQLEVYFQAGTETFRFQSTGKKEVEKWAAAINQAVTGNETAAPSTSFALPGAALVADTLRGTFDQFRTSFGGDKAPAAGKQTPAERSRSAGPCPSCGASISGFSGSTATCEYCDTETRLP